MRRRALLSTVGILGISSLAGCQSVSSDRAAPEVESSRIKVEDRTCSNAPAESATLKTDGGDTQKLVIEGTIRVPRIRDQLFVDVRNGIGFEDRDGDDIEIQVEFAPSEPKANTRFAECEGEIIYRATIELSRTPREVIIRHLVEGKDSARLKTITKRSINR